MVLRPLKIHNLHAREATRARGECVFMTGTHTSRWWPEAELRACGAGVRTHPHGQCSAAHVEPVHDRHVAAGMPKPACVSASESVIMHDRRGRICWDPIGACMALVRAAVGQGSASVCGRYRGVSAIPSTMNRKAPCRRMAGGEVSSCGTRELVMATSPCCSTPGSEPQAFFGLRCVLRAEPWSCAATCLRPCAAQCGQPDC
jgi:hypothetical protein